MPKPKNSLADKWRVHLDKQFLPGGWRSLEDALGEIVHLLPDNELEHARFVSPSGIQLDWKAAAFTTFGYKGRY